VVDAAMIDGVPAMMGLIHGFLARGAWAGRGGNWLDGASHFYRCYDCADGKFIAVGALEPQFFEHLAEGLDLPEDLRSAQHDPAGWEARAQALAAIFRTRPRDAWVAQFAGTDACVAPVLSFEEAFAHPVNAERGVFRRADGIWQAAPAPRFGRSQPADPPAPRGPGDDTDAVLAELGHAPDRIAALRDKGVLT
jgi:alpha-methylacyl-CoA racemase